MANSSQYDVIVNVITGHLEKATKELRDVGSAVDSVGKKQARAVDKAAAHNKVMNDGVRGTANSTKSFSKLAETINGGGGGLVAAYATLAANIFAVSAAFNALRGAQQSELILKGLEAQGARTGRSLTVASEKLREIVGFGISANDAMSATALFSSTGFNTTELERLGKVAKNTSLALGRSLPDSLERLIKGTTKLEPELLDELGIMTKLGDATALYGLQHNKSALSLTAFEKRQAFLNAVLAEGELKFGGLSDKVSTNPYDKLAASFENLTKYTLSWLNSSAGLINFIEFLSTSTFGLVGVILLFASTIQKSLLGSLTNLSAKTLDAAKASRINAAALTDEYNKRVAKAKATVSAELAEARLLKVNEKSAKVIRESTAAINEGTLSQQGYQRAIDASTRSIARHNSIKTKDELSGKNTAARQLLITQLDQEKVALERLMALEQKHAAQVIPLETRAIQLRTIAMSKSRLARAQESAAMAIQAAGERNLTGFITSTRIAIAQYIGSLRIVTAAKREAAAAGNVLAVASFRVNQVFSILKLGTFTLTLALKSATAAMLGLISIIGMVVLVVGILISAYEYINEKLFPNTTKAQKALDSASEEFSKTIDTQKDALEERNRMLTKSNAIGTRVIEAYKNEAAATLELSASLAKLATTYEELEKAKALDALDGVKGVQAKEFNVPIKSAALDIVPNIVQNSTLGFKALLFGPGQDEKDLVTAIDQVSQAIGPEKLTKFIIGATGSLKNFEKLTQPQQLRILANAMDQTSQAAGRLGSAAQELTSAFDAGSTASSKFFSSAIPSTTFDEIVKSFQTINISLREFEREGKSASQILETLAATPPQLQKFLPVEVTEQLDQVREKFLTINSLQEKSAEEVEKLGMTKQLADARSFVGQSQKILDSLKSQFEATQLQNEQRQASLALAKVEASFESARASKYSEFLKQNGLGKKAEIENQERLNKLNSQELEVTKSIIDGDLIRQTLAIEKLRLEQQTLETTLKTLKATEDISIQEAKNFIQKTQFNNSGLMLAGVAAPPVTTGEQEALQKAQEIIETDNKRLDIINDITKAEQALVTTKLQSKTLAVQIATINASNLTSEQKTARIAIANLEEEKRLRQDILRLSEAKSETRIANMRLEAANIGNVQENATLSTGKPAVRSAAATDVEILTLQAEDERKKLQDESSELVKDLKAKAAEYRAFAATARADEARSMVQSAKELEKRAVNEAGITAEKIKQNEAQYRLNLLNKIGLSSDEARLKAQQEINNALLEALNAAQELDTLKFDNMTKLRTGFAGMVGLSELPGEQIRVAEQKLKQEKDTQAIREQAVNIEFALLKAQREFRIEELRSAAAKLTAPEDQGTKQAAIALADQMSASLVVLEKTNKDKVTAIGQAIQNSELDVKMAKVAQSTDILLDNFKKLGPEGEAVGAVFSGMMQMTSIVGTAFDSMKNAGGDVKEQISAIAGAAAQAIGAVISMTSAISNAKIASIDKEIAAEEKRDGKSAASVEKLKALDAKKEATARKAFNLNKKLMMAQAVMSTAAGIANALATPAPYPIPYIMAGIIGAMGMAQIAVIAGTSYESSATPRAPSTPSTLSIGKRSDTVDLAKGPSASAGGEVGYIRGAEGTGSNASNYRTVGSAYGGELMRGYGSRGFVVGEKGPEVINPETPISVTPANDVQGSAPLNATFNIQALDSSDVQRVLVEQKGNIITMLRQAANASGKTFMEDVNTNVYTRPNIGKL